MTILETEVKSLQYENKENIQEELSLLQAAILNAEHQMTTSQEENSCLRQNLNLKDRVLQELDFEHQSLIKRLQISEDETLSLRRRLGSLEEDINSSMNKDSRIMQLEDDLEKALEEKELVLKVTFNQYFKNFDNNKNEQGELINSLVHDNNKYIELSQTEKQEITELENQVQSLKEQLASSIDHDTALSPSRSKLTLGPFEASNQKQLLTDVMCENVHLKRSLQKVNSDIGRLADIIERNKHNSSTEQFQLERIHKLEGRVRKLKEENNAFKKNSETLQRENDNASTELSHVKNSLLKADIDKQKANQEAIKLREIINDLDKHTGNTCFRHFPITLPYDNRTYFLELTDRRLVRSSPQIACD